MKRALLLALLLANLGVFAWYRWYLLPSQQGPALAPPLGGQPLKLTSELSEADRKALLAANPTGAPAPSTSAAPAPATTPTPAPSTSVASALACATYGPFADQDDAGQADSRLKQLGLATTQHSVAGKTKPGYWVYLPPFSSKSEADAAADLLKKRGVKDIYVVGDEANRNAISLGLYSQHDFALARIKELKKLGYHPQITERFRDEPKYWIDAKGPGATLPTADLFKDLGQEGSPVGKGTGVCTGPAG